MASVSDVRISTIARAGTPEHQVLTEADRAGDGNGRVSAAELSSRLAQPGATRLTQAKQNALTTTVLNTLAPSAAGGLSVRDYDGGVVLPREFGLKERVVTSLFGGSTFTTFDVKDKSGRKVAVLERRWRSKGIGDLAQNSFAPTFTLRNPAIRNKDRNVIAEAKPVIIDLNNLSDGLRNVIHIEDGEGNRIGTIRERWSSKLGSWLQKEIFGGSIYTQYEILDANGKVIAQSDKGELLRTTMTLTGEDGTHIGTAKRGFFNSLISDNWTVKVDDPDEIDRRILLFIAAYKTWGDKRAAEAREEKEDLVDGIIDLFGN